MSTTTVSIKKWAQRSPFSCALITPEHNYTWAQLTGEIHQFSAQLRSQGVKQGDVVTIVGKNQTESLLVYLACCELGAITALTMPQPLSALTQKLNCLYKQQQSRYLWLTDDVWLGFSDQEQQDLETSCSLLAFDTSTDRSEVEPLSKINTDDLASVIFTSGSTGLPKAVAHSFAQHFASAQGLMKEFSYGTADTWLLSLPMYHVSGLAIVYRWLAAGGCLKLGVGDLCKDIQDVTHASLVATQLSRLIASDQPLALSRVLLGGSHIPQELTKKCASFGIDTWLGYGMTEAASTVTAKQIDDNPTAGKLLPNRRLKIEGNRIYIGGETLAKGYFFQGSITPLIDLEGWFDSKDLGQWEGDELRIMGRADNQFISGGENIHCEEIEAQLNQHPDIVQSIIVPIEDSEFGHRPVAIIESSIPIDELDIVDYLQHRLERFKWPVSYYLMPQEMLNSGIKVSRSALKKWLESRVK
ncbi:o-succinylbenzoate--CoA ligase [Vibrio lamellibrachiae]|uniref:o-succinylbenzoate--CoA ligase n=1 Tax=Vibrio lamellibrachiae TaxID=2910253 RepID=UPI003D0CBA80